MYTKELICQACTSKTKMETTIPNLDTWWPDRGAGRDDVAGAGTQVTMHRSTERASVMVAEQHDDAAPDDVEPGPVLPQHPRQPPSSTSSTPTSSSLLLLLLPHIVHPS
ncbi:hypothetical protein D1007_25925 [Hordeum vulgare]|nr:hypothetical protein D1007_25925 [Hordeum vulgare]